MSCLGLLDLANKNTKLLLPKTNSCAQHMVRPNKPKRQSLEPSKVCCRAKKGQVACAQKIPDSSMGFREFLEAKFGAGLHDDSSREIKRCLVFGRKAMTNLDSILKSRDITLLTKVRLVKAMCFPVVMYECESWTIKKAEHRIIDTFELWCWRILLRAPWTARRSNQSILKEISPECSLEGLMLKLKLQYFGYLLQRTDSLEKTLILED